MLAADQFGQLVHILIDQGAKGHHHPRAALRVGVGPDHLRLCGLGNRVAQLGARGQRDPRLHFARGRVVDVGEAARRACDQLAIDPVTDLLHGIPQICCLPFTLAETPDKETIGQRCFAFLQRWRMDWDDLRIFLAVARSESLSGAGKVLRIDPATVGRRIQRLEAGDGARGFSPNPRKATP